MILFILAVISAWLLATLIIHNSKNDVPRWMHQWMYKERYNLNPKKADKTGSAATWIPFVFLLMGAPFFIVLFLCNIYTWIAQPYDRFYQPVSGWDFFRHSSVISTATVVLCLWTTFYFMKKIRGHFDYYTEDMVRKEQEDEIKKQHGASGWASEEDKNKPL